jgi:hypothetical protein
MAKGGPAQGVGQRRELFCAPFLTASSRSGVISSCPVLSECPSWDRVNRRPVVMPCRLRSHERSATDGKRLSARGFGMSPCLPQSLLDPSQPFSRPAARSSSSGPVGSQDGHSDITTYSAPPYRFPPCQGFPDFGKDSPFFGAEAKSGFCRRAVAALSAPPLSPPGRSV